MKNGYFTVRTVESYFSEMVKGLTNKEFDIRFLYGQLYNKVAQKRKINIYGVILIGKNTLDHRVQPEFLKVDINWLSYNNTP